MGTRALIIVHVTDHASDPRCLIYVQSDGYPTGTGADIVKSLAGKRLVNGHMDAVDEINGLGCAAARLVADLKEPGPGGVYIEPSDRLAKLTTFADYIYDIGQVNPVRFTSDPGALTLRVTDRKGVPLYDGLLGEFDPAALAETEGR